MKTVKYNIKDLKEMKKCLGKQLDELRLNAITVEGCLTRVEEILQSSKKANESSEVILPEDFLCFKPTINTTEKVEWKRLAKETISNSSTFLTCKMIFDKGRVLFPLQSTNQRECLKSLSSALSILSDEGKIGRFRDGRSKRIYFGDFHKHFNKDGKPNMEHFIKN